MRVSYSTLVKAKRAGRATSVRVTPTGTAVTEYQIPLGNRHSLKEAGVIGLPSWSEKTTQTETWVKVSRLSATCPRRVVTFDGGKGNIDRCMEFGDEFGGSALDGTKWLSSGTETAAVSGGLLTVTTTAGSFTSVTSLATFGDNCAIDARIKTDHAGQQGAAYEVFGSGSEAGGNFHRAYLAHVAITSRFYNSSGGTSTYADLSPAWAASTWRTLTISKHGYSDWYQDRANLQTILTNYYASALPLTFDVYAYGGNTARIYCDWVFVRKCAATEPIAGTAQPSATNRALSRALSRANLIRSCCT